MPERRSGGKWRHKWKRMKESETQGRVGCRRKRFITAKSTLLMNKDSYFSALLTSGKFQVIISLCFLPNFYLFLHSFHALFTQTYLQLFINLTFSASQFHSRCDNKVHTFFMVYLWINQR